VASVGALFHERCRVLSCIRELTDKYLYQGNISEREQHTSNRKDITQSLKGENQDMQLASDTVNFTGTVVASLVADDNEMDV
jgi:hypothetical protein